MKKIYLITCCFMLFIFSGCAGRLGNTPEHKFIELGDIKEHHYGAGFWEKNGTLYTLRGGHLDLAHIRGAADKTKKSYNEVYSALMAGKKSVSVSFGLERISNQIEVSYPSGWNSFSKTRKEPIARFVALRIAPCVGYNTTLFHEMLTWEGAKFFLIEPEFSSAFSWEDVYSNLLGCLSSAWAIYNQGDFNQGMTSYLNKHLFSLEIVSSKQAEAITKSVEGKWYTSSKIILRNMDSGYEDGSVSPCIVPRVSNQPPVAYPIPTFGAIEEYGFRVRYTISAFFPIEIAKMKKYAGNPKDIEPYKHFKYIMRGMQQEAVEKRYAVQK